MKILILCWRDIKNPSAGGSEVYFHELAKRWVNAGNKVTMICGGWSGCKKKEIIDGINIIRIGNATTLYFLAPLAYFNLKDKPNVIIDVENGLPFFSPLFTRTKKILHIHHIHKDIWFKELSLFKGLIGWFIETKIMSLVYKNTKVITLSDSSKAEIAKMNFAKNIEIVKPGITFYKNYKIFKRNIRPAVLFLNRIKKYKGIEIFLEAINKLNMQKIDFETWVAGSGDELENARLYAKKKNLRNVKFFGRISEDKKIEFMQKSWLFVNPSYIEGWGIVNIEANYFGLPVIGSRVGGIKDSVIEGKTGLLFEYKNSTELADKIKNLIKNNKLRAEMQRNAKKCAQKFDWNEKAQEYLKILNKLKENK